MGRFYIEDSLLRGLDGQGQFFRPYLSLLEEELIVNIENCSNFKSILFRYYFIKIRLSLD